MEISIGDNTYEVHRAYQPGPHTLSEAEAKALTRVFREKLKIRLATMAKNGSLTQEDVTKTENEYELGGATPRREHVRGQGQWDPVQTRAMAIARAMVRDRLKEAIAQPGHQYYGRKITDFAAEGISEAAKAIVDEDSGIMDLARQQLATEAAAKAKPVNFSLPEPTRGATA